MSYDELECVKTNAIAGKDEECATIIENPDAIVSVKQERPSVWDGAGDKNYRVYINDKLMLDIIGP